MKYSLLIFGAGLASFVAAAPTPGPNPPGVSSGNPDNLNNPPGHRFRIGTTIIGAHAPISGSSSATTFKLPVPARIGTVTSSIPSKFLYQPLAETSHSHDNSSYPTEGAGNITANTSEDELSMEDDIGHDGGLTKGTDH